MPYKDPERKRQWERDHREERNARRRGSVSNYPPDPCGVQVPLPDRIADDSSDDAKMIVGVVTGVVVVLFLAFVGLVSFSSRKAIAPTKPTSSPERQ